VRKFYKLVDEFHRMWDVVTEFDSLSNLATQMVPVSVKKCLGSCLDGVLAGQHVNVMPHTAAYRAAVVGCHCLVRHACLDSVGWNSSYMGAASSVWLACCGPKRPPLQPFPHMCDAKLVRLLTS
jgi:hypothetical protein